VNPRHLNADRHSKNWGEPIKQAASNNKHVSASQNGKRLPQHLWISLQKVPVVGK
jgi:hypothetical protein